MSEVVLGQMEHLGPGIDNVHRPCQGLPWMSEVVLGQKGYMMAILDNPPVYSFDSCYIFC